jgi:hypothetical protein
LDNTPVITGSVSKLSASAKQYSLTLKQQSSP